mmetsp:Transcript_137469/g.439211  ORF Transcript_137469/g.439211 Transcript_137469/m.439211 type:complete len:255 (-) Transcript_137469:1054-1818(-)
MLVSLPAEWHQAFLLVPLVAVDDGRRVDRHSQRLGPAPCLGGQRRAQGPADVGGRHRAAGLDRSFVFVPPAVDHAVDAASFKFHLVLSECAGLVREHELNLAQILVEATVPHPTRRVRLRMVHGGVQLHSDTLEGAGQVSGHIQADRDQIVVADHEGNQSQEVVVAERVSLGPGPVHAREASGGAVDVERAGRGGDSGREEEDAKYNEQQDIRRDLNPRSLGGCLPQVLNKLRVVAREDDQAIHPCSIPQSGAS